MSLESDVADRTDRVLETLHAEWGGADRLDPMPYGPKPWYRDEAPETVEGQLATFAGITSVVVFASEAREETVLVYSRSGEWEPPGGAVEGRESLADAAVREAAEETGFDVAVTDLLYTRRVRFRYDDGTVVPLPLAVFAGVRTGGEVRLERDELDHPGTARGVGVFSAEYLPENCRDRERIRDLLAPKDAWADLDDSPGPD